MTPERLLKEGLIQIGFSCFEEQINAFMLYLNELKKWNRAYNLTGLKTDKDIIVKHFLDSLLYLKVINEVRPKSINPPIPPLVKGGVVKGGVVKGGVVKGGEGGFSNSEPRTLNFGLKICDVGTGAGFPGIPLKIVMPEIELTLIESSRKKTAFLRHMVRCLALDTTTVYQMRVEELDEKEKDGYDIVVSRATFKIKDFLKKACPYVKKDGFLVLSKGQGVYDEIREVPHITASIKKVIKLRLPFTKMVRNLVVLDCQKFHNYE